MHLQQKIIVGILVSISIVGIIGIPIGSPKFVTNAIVLESTFIVLATLSLWRLRYTLVPNMIIAIVVIIGNTASPRHIEIMSTLDPFGNAIVLIVGGYFLQGLLIVTNMMVFKNRNRLKLKTK
jgi:hypothetical protein